MTALKKMIMATAGSALAISLAIGGAAAAPGNVPGAPSTDACRVEPLDELIGEPASEANILKARQLSGAKAVRVIEAGAMVTMDFRTDRLNVELGKNGKIAHLRCG